MDNGNQRRQAVGLNNQMNMFWIFFFKLVFYFEIVKPEIALLI